MKKFIHFYKNNFTKIIPIFFFLALLGAYTQIFAIGSPYAPGATLDPACAPGSSNCTVNTLPDQSLNAGKILTTNGSTTSWSLCCGDILNSLNAFTGDVSIITGTAGADFNITSTSNSIIINLPDATASIRGALTSSDWTTFNNKANLTATLGSVLFSNGSHDISQDNSKFFYDLTNHRLGLGTAVPSYTLHVTGAPAAGTPVAEVANTLGGTTENNGLLVLAGNDTGVAASQMITFERTDSTVIGSISQNAATTVAYNTASDARLKENFNLDIPTTSKGLSDLLQIKVVDFDFKNDPSHTATQGFIAQQLNTVYPYAVTPNGDNGIDALDQGKTPWMVDYGRLTPLIVKSIQDIDTKINNLELKISGISSAPSSGAISDFFSSVVINISGTVASLKDLVVDTIKVGSSAKRTGITLYDEVTGDPYCVSVANGAEKVTAGECSIITPPTPQIIPVISPTPDPIIDPSVILPTSDQAPAPAPDPVIDPTITPPSSDPTPAN